MISAVAQERAEEVGWKRAVRERDSGTFDWTANKPFDAWRRELGEHGA